MRRRTTTSSKFERSLAGQPLGYLWAGALNRIIKKVAYIYQLQVLPQFRRQGHGRAALQEFEVIAKSLGFESVASTCSAAMLEPKHCTARSGSLPRASACKRISCRMAPPNRLACESAAANPASERTLIGVASVRERCPAPVSLSVQPSAASIVGYASGFNHG